MVSATAPMSMRIVGAIVLWSSVDGLARSSNNLPCEGIVVAIILWVG